MHPISLKTPPKEPTSRTNLSTGYTIKNQTQPINQTENISLLRTADRTQIDLATHQIRNRHHQTKLRRKNRYLQRRYQKL